MRSHNPNIVYYINRLCFFKAEYPVFLNNCKLYFLNIARVDLSVPVYYNGEDDGRQSEEILWPVPDRVRKE